MKVLVIGGNGTISIRGQRILDMLHGLGYEAVYETVEQVEERRIRIEENLKRIGGNLVYFDECSEYQMETISQITKMLHPEINAEENRRKPKGPRGRWGKLK